MKKVNALMLGLIIALGLSSCIKEGETYDPAAQYELEKAGIETYAKANLTNLEYKDLQGFRIWFEVTPGEPGSYEYKITNGQIEAPTITVNYTGRLLNGTKFDENQTETGHKTSLGNVIAAWQIAFLPEKIGEEIIGGLTATGLQKGAKIRVITPSYFAYRNVA